MTLDKYVRVTTVLAPYAGYKDIPDAQRYKVRGTAVHAACDCLLRGGSEWEADITAESVLMNAQYAASFEEVKPYVTSFINWWREKTGFLKPVLFAGNRFYGGDDLPITGEPDVVLDNARGNKILVDIKTSVKPCKTWPLQLSAYKHLVDMSAKIDAVDELWILQLAKGGSDAAVRKFDYDIETFRKAYELYDKFFRKKRDTNLDAEDEASD